MDYWSCNKSPGNKQRKTELLPADQPTEKFQFSILVLCFFADSVRSPLADSRLKFISEYDGKHFALQVAPWHHLSDYWTNNLCKPAPGWLSEAYFALRAQAAVSACLWNWLGSLGDFLLKVHANSTIHHWTWFNHGPSFRVLWIEEAENFYYKSEEKWLMKRNSFFLASMFHQIIDIFLCTFFAFCLKVTRR